MKNEKREVIKSLEVLAKPLKKIAEGGLLIMRKEKIIATLTTGNNFKKVKKEAQIFFTRHAEIDIDDVGLTKTSIRLLIEAASEYLLQKKEDEVFAIITPSLPIKLFIKGRVVYRDEEEMEILITKVLKDIFITTGDMICEI